MPFFVTKPGSCIILKDKTRNYLKKEAKAYEEGEESFSILQSSRFYMVSKTSFWNKINRRRDKPLYGVTKRRLTQEEEESIQS